MTETSQPSPRSAPLSRRAFLERLAASVPAGWVAGAALGARPARAADPAGRRADRLGFERVPPSTDDRLVLPPGYGYDVLARWGDALLAGAPSLPEDAPGVPSAEDQRRQFGFNCDWVGFFPLGRGRSDRGLLCVNHEYTRRGDMFPAEDLAGGLQTRHVEVELAAHGMSIVEVARGADGRWARVPGSRYTRRVTGTTPMRFSGAAAGDARLGETVAGMLNNCSGGRTPWGTVLTCEENVQTYFANGADADDAWQRRANATFPIAAGASPSGWEATHPRFDLSAPGQQHEANRFGWVVEIDPFDPGSTPRKRTSLGRCRHEAATCRVAGDGRVAVYMGDDTRGTVTEGGFVYKFVTRGRLDPWRRAPNRDLLDEGTLLAARLDDDGRGRWLPLVPEGPLAGWTQAEILIDARGAARVLGATPLDRPEDVEAHPFTGRVYVALTNHPPRGEGRHPANARAHNRHGHVLEVLEDGGDAAATSFSWDVFLLGGDPAVPAHGAFYPTRDGELDPLACPDNLAFDPAGHLWIATDGQPGTLGHNDALYAVPTSGPGRARPRRFLAGPVGCEICGPELTPDGTTLFVAIQHPGEGGGLRVPASRWPDGAYPRPSVVAITRGDGGPIGA